MSSIGQITLEIVGWQTIETRVLESTTELQAHVAGTIRSALLKTGSEAEVYVDGHRIRGCSAYTVNLPVRGIITATLTLSPAVDRSSEQVLDLLARWGVKRPEEKA